MFCRIVFPILSCFILPSYHFPNFITSFVDSYPISSSASNSLFPTSPRIHVLLTLLRTTPYFISTSLCVFQNPLQTPPALKHYSFLYSQVVYAYVYAWIPSPSLFYFIFTFLLVPPVSYITLFTPTDDTIFH